MASIFEDPGRGPHACPRLGESGSRRQSAHHLHHATGSHAPNVVARVVLLNLPDTDEQSGTVGHIFRRIDVLCTARRHREWACRPEPLHGRSCEQPHRRLRPAPRPLRLERTHQAHETPRDGMSGMRSANERNPAADRRATAFSAERQEAVRLGLRIVSRMIARAHLRRQASQSLPAPRRPAEREDGD